MSYSIISAVGNFIVVEAAEESKVLKTEETSTVLRVISVGETVNNNDKPFTINFIMPGDLIIVYPNSVEKAMMGGKWVYFVRNTDVIARLKNE